MMSLTISQVLVFLLVAGVSQALLIPNRLSSPRAVSAILPRRQLSSPIQTTSFPNSPRNGNDILLLASGYSRRQASPRRDDSALRAASLISATDTWGNLAVLVGSATLAQRLGKTTKIGKLLGPPVTAMALVFGLASIGILAPGGTLASKSLQWWALHLATPLVLLGADLQDCVSRCGPLLVSFLAASGATLIACVVGWKLVGAQMMASALGSSNAIKIAAALMAKNIGGGINYIAVCQSLQASPQAVAAGLVVDNIFALIYFPATSALAAGRPDVVDKDAGASVVQGATKILGEAQNMSSTKQDDVFQICNVFFLASALLWLGQQLARKIGSGDGAALPLCTLLTLGLAGLAPSKWTQAWRSSAETLGTVCLYLFFATAGAPGMAIADSVQSALIPISLFLSCLYGIHFAILAGLHKVMSFFGKDKGAFLPQRLLVASSAAIGGPATAVALAQANRWPSLLVPSLLVGNIGYAIATFLGLAFARYFG